MDFSGGFALGYMMGRNGGYGFGGHGLFIVVSILLWGMWLLCVGAGIWIAITESLMGGIMLSVGASITLIPTWIWMLIVELED